MKHLFYASIREASFEELGGRTFGSITSVFWVEHGLNGFLFFLGFLTLHARTTHCTSGMCESGVEALRDISVIASEVSVAENMGGLLV